jgi:hypothetical protein
MFLFFLCKIEFVNERGSKISTPRTCEMCYVKMARWNTHMVTENY